MARKKEKKEQKVKVKVEKLPKKEEQMGEDELKKVSGGIPAPIDCWKPKV